MEVRSTRRATGESVNSAKYFLVGLMMFNAYIYIYKCFFGKLFVVVGCTDNIINDV